jgi:hypothetical protein
MPIEVRELVIKATITQEDGSGPMAGSSSSNNTVSDKEEIISICVEKILEILKDKGER